MCAREKRAINREESMRDERNRVYWTYNNVGTYKKCKRFFLFLYVVCFCDSLFFSCRSYLILLRQIVYQWWQVTSVLYSAMQRQDFKPSFLVRPCCTLALISHLAVSQEHGTLRKSVLPNPASSLARAGVHWMQSKQALGKLSLTRRSNISWASGAYPMQRE